MSEASGVKGSPTSSQDSQALSTQWDAAVDKTPANKVPVQTKNGSLNIQQKNTVSNKAANSDKSEKTGKSDDDKNLSIDELRKKYDISDFSGDGLTDIKVDGDETVGEKATEDFIQKIRDEVKSGKLKKDSDEAKLVDLLDAQGATDNGYDLYGYIELPESGGSTYRETQTKPTHLTGDDAKELIDQDKLASKISELMQKDGISDRYEDALKGAIKKIPGDKRKDISDKVEGALFKPGGHEANTNFEDYVIAAQEKAQSDGDEDAKDKIQKEVNNYFEALQALDPDHYTDRKQAFNQNMMTHQIDGYMENPDSVDAKNAKTGLRDAVDIWQAGINGALQAMDKGTKTYNETKELRDYLNDFKHRFEGISDDDAKKAYLAISAAEKATGDANISEDQKERIINKVVKDNMPGIPERQGELTKFISKASSTGALGALSGTMSFVSAGVQLANGSWDDMSTDERIGAVRDLVGGLSFANDFAKFGSNIVETLGGKTTDADGNVKPNIKATSWLGLLGDNFPDIWKTNQDAQADDVSKAISKEIKEKVNNGSNAVNGDAIEMQDLPGADGQNNGNTDLDRVAQAAGAQITGQPTSGQSGDGSKSDIAKKTGRSFLRFTAGAGLDITGGVMDIVTGVRSLKKADSALEKAGAGLSIAGGSSTTAMALSNTVAMLAPKGVSLAANLGSNIGTKVAQGLLMGSRVAGPVLGIAGTIFGIAGALIAEAVNHKKMQKLTDEQGDFFKRLEGYGVTNDDWGDKLEFARYESYMYGGRDTPDDKSIFDYQKDEWEHFQDTLSDERSGKKKDKGTSLDGLAPNLHHDGDPGTDNLWEKFLTGTTTRQNGKDSTSHTDDWRPWDETDQDAGKPDGDLGTDELRKKSRMDAMMRLYGKDFLENHEKEITTIATHWNDWGKGDNTISRDDLKDIAKDTDGRSKDERDAAQFLLDENGFYDGLDSLHGGGDGDAKINDKDLNDWLGELGKGDVDEFRQKEAASKFGSDYLDDHEKEFQTIAERWDDWNGKDSIVSDKDLDKIAKDKGKSDDERDAAQFLLDNKDFFDTLDTFQKGGDGEGKISTKDFDDWFSTIGKGSLDDYRQESAVGGFDSDFYHEHEKELKTIREHWDDWNGKDAIVSDKDLNKIAKDKNKSADERDAAQFLLDNTDFKDTLDTFQKNDGHDGKISTEDLDDWLKTIGVK